MMIINKLLQGNPLRISIVLGLVTMLIMIVIKDIKKLFNKDKKKSIIYAIVFLLVFALTGLLSSKKVLNDTILNSYIGFQILFLIFGGLHIFTMRFFFPELSKNKSKFFPEFFMTLIFFLIGLIAFINITGRIRPQFSTLFLTSTIVFFVPLLFYKLYERALLIPMPIYKKWRYPVGETIKDPTISELQNPLVISLELKKGKNSTELTNFRVKAPENLEFDRLFYFFIIDYNETHPEEEIEFLNEDNTPTEWVFYKKTFLGNLKYIDHSKTINKNDIKEDNVVICKRV